MKRLKVDLVDEHYYRPPQWFLDNATRYDSYDRKGPKVFAGEYASHHKNRKNNFESALTEASFMTGLERNADVVHMATYAPLLAHVDAWQWRPDLIWFDNLRMVRTPNYYVQKLYGHYAGTNVLPLTWKQAPLTGQEGLYGSAVIDTNKNEIIVKLSNVSQENRQIVVSLEGMKKKMQLRPEVETILLKGGADEENTLDTPDAIVPVSTSATLNASKLSVDVEPYSFNLFVIGYTD